MNHYVSEFNSRTRSGFVNLVGLALVQLVDSTVPKLKQLLGNNGKFFYIFTIHLRSHMDWFHSAFLAVFFYFQFFWNRSLWTVIVCKRVVWKFFRISSLPPSHRHMGLKHEGEYMAKISIISISLTFMTTLSSHVTEWKLL